MASVSIYLNFDGKTEEAFEFYKSVFGTEYEGNGMMRMEDVPSPEGVPEMSEEMKQQIMHVTLPILNGFQLMGSDAPEEMTGRKLVMGNSMYINLEPDSREEGDRLFKALSEGGKVEQEMQDMFWGDYWGAFTDKYGIQWMINVAQKTE